jgi:hypothetical protein
MLMAATLLLSMPENIWEENNCYTAKEVITS